ncbi:MAG: hypothetical protein BA867_12055 [Desulfobacterales bacterium S5133MH16]|nr:MAG: hypothetical protein BA867_12055 [Desulfobacterales bacterium S5133MH16]
MSAIKTSAEPTPRGLRQHRAAQRRASNQASDEQGALGESTAMAVPEYHVQCKKGHGMAASRVMGTGEPQWPSEEAANPR